MSPAKISADSTAEKNKLLGLELLRFVSAVAVLIFHYPHFAFQGVDQPPVFDKSIQPLYSVLALFYEYGYHGVSIFWCISGFIFFWRYRDSIADARVGGRKFFILRFSRLYPLHLTTLVAVALLQFIYSRETATFFVYRYNDLRHFVLQLFMASNWGFELGDSFNGPIWSISVEVLVYGVFFLVLAFVSRSWFVNVTVLVLCGAARVVGFHPNVIDCLMFFYMGGLSAIAYRSIRSARLRSALTSAALIASVIMLFLIWMFALYRRPSFAFIFLLCYIPVLIFWLCADFKVGPAARRWIEAAGNMTYSSYLLHFPLQLILLITFTALGSSVPFLNTGFFCLFMSGTLLASYYVYKYLEVPAQRMLRLRLK